MPPASVVPGGGTTLMPVSVCGPKPQRAAAERA